MKTPDVVCFGICYCSLQFFNLNFMVMMKKTLFLSTPARGSGSLGMMKKLLLGGIFSLAMMAGKAQVFDTFYQIVDADTGAPVPVGTQFKFVFTSGGGGYEIEPVQPGGWVRFYSPPGSTAPGSQYCGKITTLDPCVKIIGDPNSCMTGANHYISVRGLSPQLIIRDAVNDAGIQPNPSTDVWTSPDLWNRRDNNGNPNDNQDPGYGSGTLGNLMKVRIKNIGCATSQQSYVRLYWTLGQTGEHWPNSWNGVEKINNVAAGAEIQGGNWTVSGYVIGPLAPGAETIVQGKWFPPNPASYVDPNQPSQPSPVASNAMICFLARIDDPAHEPMYSELSSATTSTGHNIRFNNNIATRN